MEVDEVVETLGGFARLTPDGWRRAQEVAGEIAGAWLRRGTDVLAPGPYFERREIEAVLAHVPDDAAVTRAVLHSTYEVALGRVADDPTRRMSADEIVDALMRALPAPPRR